MSVSSSQPIYFIDSNVWLYAFLSSNDAEDKRKAEIAKNVIQNQRIIISTQVINEVSVNLLKKKAIQEKQLSNLIQSYYNKYQTVDFTENNLIYASTLRQKYHLSFWDSLIISSALLDQANYLYSEDMQHGLRIEKKLEIINPFQQLE